MSDWHTECADPALCASRECEVYQRIKAEDPTRPGTMDALMADAELDDLADIAKTLLLKRKAQDDLRAAVARARANGQTWTIIGSIMGISKQAARERFGP